MQRKRAYRADGSDRKPLGTAESAKVVVLCLPDCSKSRSPTSLLRPVYVSLFAEGLDIEC